MSKNAFGTMVKTDTCQGCSMPMQSAEDYGTEGNGSQSNEYCTHCYQGGSFRSPDITIDQMVGTLQEQMGLSGDEAKTRLLGLKRWR